MNNFSKACSDVFSTMNNLEHMLGNGSIHNGDIASANGYLSELKRMNDWLTQSEEQYAKIEQFVNELSYSTWKAERIKLNIVDIAPDDSELERRKKYLINSIRRAGIKPTVRDPLMELDISSKTGYYRTLQIMSNNSMIIEITITYPPNQGAKLGVSTSDNNHPTSERLHQLHQDIERYLMELIIAADLVGRANNAQQYPHLDNIINKITEVVAVA